MQETPGVFLLSKACNIYFVSETKYMLQVFERRKNTRCSTHFMATVLFIQLKPFFCVSIVFLSNQKVLIFPDKS